MEKKLFRKKSLDRISSPEQLNEYLHVTSPAVFIVLLAIILLLVCALYFVSDATLESYIEVSAVVADDILTVTFEDQDEANRVESGMNIMIGDVAVPITFKAMNTEGQYIAGGPTSLPDGQYSATIGYSEVQLIKLLYN